MAADYSVNDPLPDPIRHAEFYAGVPVKRLLAWGIDTVLVILAVALVVPFTAFVGLFFLPLLWLTISFVYRVATLAAGSATWGMRIVGIELRDYQAQRLSLPTAFAHTLGYTLSISVVLVQVVSMVLMATTARGQGLSDMALGTVAINRPAG